MYEEMDVFVMFSKAALPAFVENAINNRSIPFVVIRNKKLLARLAENMKQQNELQQNPIEVVLTLSYKNDEYLN